MKFLEETFNIFAVNAPSCVAIMPLKFDIDIMSANKLPSTPSSHFCAVYTIRGIKIIWFVNDSIHPSVRTSQKAWYLPVTTNNCGNRNRTEIMVATINVLRMVKWRK